MLAALSIPAVGLGVAGGGLVATVLALVTGGAFSVAGVENGSGIGLLVGVLVGLGFGGWVAGRLAVHSHRFHGSVVGLLLAGVIIALASLGAAQTSVLTVLWLAFIAAVVGGLGGWLGGRNRHAVAE